jgi:hypothetical protein
MDVRAGEIWKDVPSAPGYKVSSRGRVLGFSGRILKRINRCGYPSVTVVTHDGNRTMLVHRMVLEAFVGPQPEGCEGCHINGNRGDARPENLRWASQLENMRDRDVHGRTACMERHGLAKLTQEAVAEARALHANGTSLSALAKMTGVSKSTIWAAVRGDTWCHAL